MRLKYEPSQILLDAGARSDAKDSWGNTPGVYALRGDFAEYFTLELQNHRKVRPACFLWPKRLLLLLFLITLKPRVE